MRQFNRAQELFGSLALVATLLTGIGCGEEDGSNADPPLVEDEGWAVKRAPPEARSLCTMLAGHLTWHCQQECKIPAQILI